jgi:uncharacterized membrane protein
MHPTDAALDEPNWAERIAAFLGTVRFLIIQTVVVLVWISLNIVGISFGWDPYPFILLNLAFSTQAAYAAPLILLAQHRQEDVDRSRASHDYEVNQEALDILKEAKQILDEIHLKVVKAN